MDEDLYFQKDRNQKAHPNITSRDLVCNFDRQGFHYRWKIFSILVMKFRYEIHKVATIQL